MYIGGFIPPRDLFQSTGDNVVKPKLISLVDTRIKMPQVCVTIVVFRGYANFQYSSLWQVVVASVSVVNTYPGFLVYRTTLPVKRYVITHKIKEPHAVWCFNSSYGVTDTGNKVPPRPPRANFASEFETSFALRANSNVFEIGFGDSY